MVFASVGADEASESGISTKDRDGKTLPVLGLKCSCDSVKVLVQFGQVFRPGLCLQCTINN